MPHQVRTTPPPWPRVRRFWTGVGREGFHLTVVDRWLVAEAAERANEAMLAALGHPCCGRGPFGREVLGLFWWKILQWPNFLSRYDHRVIEIPLTTEQALIIQPSWNDGTWWRKEDDVESDGEEVVN
jgi:hypothetical protein